MLQIYICNICTIDCIAHQNVTRYFPITGKKKSNEKWFINYWWVYQCQTPENRDSGTFMNKNPIK